MALLGLIKSVLTFDKGYLEASDAGNLNKG